MWNTVDPWKIEVKGTDSHAIENPPITVDSPKLNYSQPSVSVRDPHPWIPRSSKTLKSLLWNGVKQCTQLLLHICGFATAARKCYFWPLFGWIYKCKTWEYGGPTVYLLKHNPHISRPGQFKPVLSKVCYCFSPLTQHRDVTWQSSLLAKSLGLGRTHEALGLTLS